MAETPSIKRGAKIVADPGTNWKAVPDEPLGRAWDRALRLIAACKRAGADAVKWQLLRADQMYQPDTKAWHVVKPYELPDEWLPRLKDACDDEGVEFACTAYSAESVPLIDPLVSWHKVASFDLPNDALLTAIARTQKPVVLSLGMATVVDQLRAYSTLCSEWQRIDPGGIRVDATWLLCVSQYPCAATDYDVRRLNRYSGDCDGVSDHTRGDCTVLGAIAAAHGARVIERHVCLSHDVKGPDEPASADPEQFARYVRVIREVEAPFHRRTEAQEWTQYRFDPATGRRASD